MLRKRKLFVRPKKAYEKTRIQEENVLVEKYGLKSKREVWKTIAKVNYYRRRAKSLAKASTEEQEVLFGKLRKIGLSVHSIADVLALNIEDLLKRRLSTIVAHKGLANTPKQARQMIVHKKISINGNIINVPSYTVSVEEEKSLLSSQVIKKLKKSEKSEKQEEVVE